MGLIKKDGCIIRGVEIKPAYAKLLHFSVAGDEVEAVFGVSTTRENLNNGLALEEYNLSCNVDTIRDQVFNEIYTQAKETIFPDWVDDIKEEELEN